MYGIIRDMNKNLDKSKGIVYAIDRVQLSKQNMKGDFRMTYIISQLFFYGIPVVSVLFFGVILYRYCYAKYRNKRTAGSYGEDELKLRRNILILSAVILGVLLAAVIGFSLLLLMAVAFM